MSLPRRKYGPGCGVARPRGGHGICATCRGEEASRRRPRQDRRGICPCGRNGRLAWSKGRRTPVLLGHLYNDPSVSKCINYNYDSFYERILTRLETGHGLSNLQDFTRTLVSQSIVPRHNHRSNMAMFPKVNVRATDTSCTHMHQTLMRC